MSLRDDRKLLQGLRNLFARAAAMIAGDPYELIQSEFDALEISCPKGKGVFFASDVTKEQREAHFARNPDHVSFWMTPAGQHLKEVTDHFLKTKEDEGGLPQISFDDLKSLKIYLARRFAEEADYSFTIVCNNPRANDIMLEAVVEALDENQAVEWINGENFRTALNRFKRKPETNPPEENNNTVVSLNDWKKRKQPKPE